MAISNKYTSFSPDWFAAAAATSQGGTPLGLVDLIAMRLRIPPNATMPFEFIEAHRIDEDRVVVFLVHNQQPLMIEDDGSLFPSDTLVTQLRLLTK